MEDQGYLVRGPLALVLQVSRFLGVAPLRWERQGNGYYIRNSSFMSHYSRILLMIMSNGLFTDILSAIGLILDMFNFGTKKAVRVHTMSSLFIWLVDFVLVLIVTGLGVYQGPYRMTRLMQYLKNIEKVNIRLKNVPGLPTDRWLTIGIVVITIGLYLLMGLDFGYYILDAIAHGKEMIVVYIYGCQYFKYGMALFLHLQIALVIFQAKSGLQTINDRLRELVSLREIADCYVTICNVVSDINKENGILLIVMYVSFVSYLVISNYYLIAAMCSPIGFMRNFNIALQFIWCIYHSMKIFLLIEPCHRTHEQMDETRVLASQLTYRMTRPGQPLPAELETFQKQLILYNPTYSPLSICTLNRSQIAAIVAGVTTYLLIIVQQRLIDECG
nr:gustatory receptor 4 [Papilio glaucus]